MNTLMESKRPSRNLKRDSTRLEYYMRDDVSLEKKAKAIEVADMIIRDALENKGTLYPGERVSFNMPAAQRVYEAWLINKLDRFSKRFHEQYLPQFEKLCEEICPVEQTIEWQTRGEQSNG